MTTVLAERVKGVEVMVTNIEKDVTEIKDDVKELLTREAQRDADVKQMKGQMRRMAVWASTIVTGALNVGFLWFRVYVEGGK